jgi:hypothetical protein
VPGPRGSASPPTIGQRGVERFHAAGQLAERGLDLLAGLLGRGLEALGGAGHGLGAALEQLERLLGRLDGFQHALLVEADRVLGRLLQLALAAEQIGLPILDRLDGGRLQLGVEAHAFLGRAGREIHQLAKDLLVGVGPDREGLYGLASHLREELVGLCDVRHCVTPYVRSVAVEATGGLAIWVQDNALRQSMSSVLLRCVNQGVV